MARGSVKSLGSKKMGSLSRFQRLPKNSLTQSDSLNTTADLQSHIIDKISAPIVKRSKNGIEDKNAFEKKKEVLRIHLHHISIINKNISLPVPFLSIWPNSLYLIVDLPSKTRFQIPFKSLSQIYMSEDEKNFVILFRKTEVLSKQIFGELLDEDTKTNRIWLFLDPETDVQDVAKLKQLFRQLCKIYLVKLHLMNFADLQQYFKNEVNEPKVPKISTTNFYSNLADEDSRITRARRKKINEEQPTEIDLATEDGEDLDTKLSSKLTHQPTKESKSKTPLPVVADEEIGEGKQLVLTHQLCYQFKDSRKIVINNSDFKCLYNNNWINDNVIDFFLKYYVQDFNEARVELFSCFLYSKLITPNHSVLSVYDNVKNWFRNNDTLFENDFVIIPINHNYHWFCIIIQNLKNIVNGKYLSKDIHNFERPYLYVLDSLKQSHGPATKAIRLFLAGYAKEKLHLDINTQLIKTRTLNVLLQNNFNDCGLHLIFNICKFTTKHTLFMDLIKSRLSGSSDTNRITTELFPVSGMRTIRKDLRDIILSLLKQNLHDRNFPQEDVEKVGQVMNGDLKNGCIDSEGAASFSERVVDQTDDLEILDGDPAMIESQIPFLLQKEAELKNTEH
ncbi:Peptidase [Komagataella phaffii CBS 7435]|uniref:Peptidase that deconjugates Smt3/SUMO-1 peptides from proteins n=2 Tax=Komagataella phaffii TaxID=460519 RepID=C4QVU0_KOMPG|nr:uncharacterized protein PAS_chr1-1_0010 [Komagataella phaffii GS115]AOA60396.1 GQ67_02567T0 [Komagataella phaffii]CAH2446022.1 Peptidase [Komagataella phaffii CBS 7435]AOA65392.1 GQ68_02681T0 [Komagataella phaffii GS115]CAY67363.1 Peptidase that deconjugates Smt3/SUMO-1 peptides from proteins [Komagataella phaffii GS115]CCA36463.1 Peptidase [Komagataella phaffii CBS 7435]